MKKKDPKSPSIYSRSCFSSFSSHVMVMFLYHTSSSLLFHILPRQSSVTLSIIHIKTFGVSFIIFSWNCLATKKRINFENWIILRLRPLNNFITYRIIHFCLKYCFRLLSQSSQFCPNFYINITTCLTCDYLFIT